MIGFFLFLFNFFIGYLVYSNFIIIIIILKKKKIWALLFPSWKLVMPSKKYTILTISQLTNSIFLLVLDFNRYFSVLLYNLNLTDFCPCELLLVVSYSFAPHCWSNFSRWFNYSRKKTSKIFFFFFLGGF